MTGDSITEARQALREAVSLLPALGKEAAGPLSDALDRVARSLDRIEGLESRLAIQMELLDERLLRVENNRVFAAWRAILSKAARFRRPPHESGTGDYAAWVAHQQSALPSIDAARATSSQWRRKPLMAVLPLVADITVEPQWYPHTTTVADADYMCLISAPGRVSPLALHFAAEALQAGDCDIIYGDEDHIDSNGGRTDPIFRPGWSPDLLTSSPYMGSLVIVSRHVLDDIGGIRPGFEASDLHDLTLRATDSRTAVLQVPRVLFHRSAAEPPPDTPLAIKDAIARREHIEAQVTPGPAPHSSLVRRHGVPEVTAIICSRSPRLLATCLESLRVTAADVIRKIIVIAHEENGSNNELRSVIQRYGAETVPFTGVFNFSAMNNLGASKAPTPHLLFLNDDIRAASTGWAELLTSHLFCERIGIAGAVLRYPSGGIQHAGIVSGINDGLGHVGRHAIESRLWPWLLMTRNVSAVTGACLAIRANTFRSLGGFDPAFPNNYNDVDLCFRVREAGLNIVCVAVPGLIHSECKTRPGIVRFHERYRLFQRWGQVLSRPDPYYSRSLAPSERIGLNLAPGSGALWQSC
jgi:GT2 family glycosyltransferase